jgi:RND family efflux transporter MFP subunit
MPGRRIQLLALAAAVVALAACENKKAEQAALPATTVVRGNIAVRVQATGTVEPINPVDIKSKAQGQIIKLPVEVGSVVKKGQEIAQIDPRDVKNQYDQAVADDVVSFTSLQATKRDQARRDSLFAVHVVTASEHDSSKATLAAAQADLVNKRAALDLRRQALEDATVEAPLAGTVVSRPTTQGTIITSATAANGGTTLMTIADLGRVRMRVTIDEVEMANVRVGETATVAVDAFPDHIFDGIVEKVEPQAVVTQGVTFFQALVSISNKEGLLMPGMNGEVTIRAADLSQVIQIPIDAIRPTNELAPVARMFGLSVDSITNQMRKDLLGTEGTTGVPGRYVVVALADGSYEMRLVKTGPTDLRVQEITDGVTEGDKVVMLGAIIMGKPAVPPTLRIAANIRRAPTPAASPQTQVGTAGAAGTQAGQPARAGQPKPATPKPTGETTQTPQAGSVRKP